MREEQDKYYFPDLSEFHEGLRCEIRDPWERNEEDRQWEPYVFTFNTHDDMPHEYDTGFEKYRVKYLDRADIEELGWELIKEEDSPFTGKKSSVLTYQMNKEIGFNTGSNYYLYFRTDGITPSLTIKEETYGSWSTYSYEMNFVIKNYGELKTLMKQLNI